MGKLDRKKFREETKKLEDIFEDDPLDSFEGPKSELYLLKLSRFLSRHRKEILIGMGCILFIFIAAASYFEIEKYIAEQATIAIEKIEKTHLLKDKTIDLNEKIKDFELLQSEYTSSTPKKRIYKVLSDFYARNGNFDKAAVTIEKIALEIDEPKEVKAYYFYLAGNYREQSKDNLTALKNYSVSASLLLNNRKVPAFAAWSFYQCGRLRYSAGDKDGAIKDFKKVLEIEPEGDTDNYAGSLLLEAKQLASYLLIKINRG